MLRGRSGRVTALAVLIALAAGTPAASQTCRWTNDQIGGIRSRLADPAQAASSLQTIETFNSLSPRPQARACMIEVSAALVFHFFLNPGDAPRVQALLMPHGIMVEANLAGGPHQLSTARFAASGDVFIRQAYELIFIASRSYDRGTEVPSSQRDISHSFVENALGHGFGWLRETLRNVGNENRIVFAVSDVLNWISKYPHGPSWHRSQPYRASPVEILDDLIDRFPDRSSDIDARIDEWCRIPPPSPYGAVCTHYGRRWPPG
jgi:hypothetical protein